MDSATQFGPPVTSTGPLPYVVKSFPKRGLGLVAKQRYGEGQCIYSEEVMVTTKTLEDAKGAVDLYNKILHTSMKEVKDTEFKRKFFELPKGSKEKYGILGSVFDRGAISVPLQAGNARALGLRSAFLNHSCRPNAQHTLLTVNTPVGESYIILLHACRDIEVDEEITVAYEFIYANIANRQEYTLENFGFECACELCENRDPAVEAGIELLSLKVPIMLMEKAVATEPAGTLQMAHTIIDVHIKSGFTSDPLGQIWKHCAMICAWHSDIGRAMEFLGKAKSIFLKIEGTEGPNFKWMSKLQEDPMKLEKAGTTKRGYSSKKDVQVIWDNPDRRTEILFMLDAKELGDYIKLSDYSEDGEFVGAEDRDPNIDVDELVKELEAEKKEFDESRMHENPSKAKKKSKKKKGKKGKRSGSGDGNATEKEDAKEGLDN
ncbi:hypothetical protein FQN55_006631 [Onygenales sp. PD_40]|nr:hypothetical protein FQN55_006631 [Onygenales sp. PD_40]KAK2789454.1 hypothetical protein FQN53_001901 [Emmonsiellopsis sp. PD_33]